MKGFLLTLLNIIVDPMNVNPVVLPVETVISPSDILMDPVLSSIYPPGRLTYYDFVYICGDIEMKDAIYYSLNFKNMISFSAFPFLYSCILYPLVEPYIQLYGTPLGTPLSPISFSSIFYCAIFGISTLTTCFTIDETLYDNLPYVLYRLQQFNMLNINIILGCKCYIHQSELMLRNGSDHYDWIMRGYTFGF